MTAPVTVSRHPLVRHKLAQLRDAATPPVVFRRLVRDLSRLMLVEATADLPLEPVTVRTPLADCPAHRLAGRLGLAPILRAGLGMAEAILDLLPEAEVWHLGLYRDHRTARPVTYYNKLTPGRGLDTVLVLDPMLATGGSAAAAATMLKEAGVPRLVFLGLIGAPEGVATLHADHPDVPVYLAGLDTHLDADKYIVPGLGDAGDRQFGTLPPE